MTPFNTESGMIAARCPSENGQGFRAISEFGWIVRLQDEETKIVADQHGAFIRHIAEAAG